MYHRDDTTHVILDPHVLTNVGRYYRGSSSDLFLMIPVSYYLSSNDYRNGISGLVMDKYLACGIISMNLSTMTIDWLKLFVRVI